MIKRKWISGKRNELKIKNKHSEQNDHLRRVKRERTSQNVLNKETA